MPAPRRHERMHSFSQAALAGPCPCTCRCRRRPTLPPPLQGLCAGGWHRRCVHPRVWQPHTAASGSRAPSGCHRRWGTGRWARMHSCTRLRCQPAQHCKCCCMRSLLPSVLRTPATCSLHRNACSFHPPTPPAAGLCGLMDPVEPGLACGSDTAHLSLFGCVACSRCMPPVGQPASPHTAGVSAVQTCCVPLLSPVCCRRWVESLVRCVPAPALAGMILASTTGGGAPLRAWGRVRWGGCKLEGSRR